MSEERNIDPFSIMILVLSVIAIVTEIIGPFAGFYLGGSSYRWSCLDCEYSTGLDYALQIIIIILFVIQIVIALNELLPNKFIPMDITKYGMYIAITTIVFAIVGLASFGITYAYYEWWPELGFYGLVIGGVLNTILFFLQQRNK
ncbi:MAG: hypothetical protein HWN79_06835 [Candidatus Lokiarchaeota archaeon]|nr:hypothetical protein [Candidatus Lokiarchaeota archaeon]